MKLIPVHGNFSFTVIISICLNSDVRVLTGGSRMVLLDFFFSLSMWKRVFQVKLILDTVDILQRYNWALFQLSFIWTAELGPS